VRRGGRQENGLVPIVEPEVTLGPGDYTIEETAFWSERVYSHVFRLLHEYNVMLARAAPAQGYHSHK